MDIANASKEQDEFVTAESRNGVAGAHALAQTLGHFNQHAVAGGVAVFIIDRFEAIEIEVTNRQHFMFAFGLRHRQLQAVGEQNAVG